MTQPAATDLVNIGGLTVSPARRRLFGPAGELSLEPMVLRLLLLLGERLGDVVERRFLFDALWGRAEVGDDSLNRLIAALRKALAQVSAGRASIETVPRSGYRLLIEQAENQPINQALHRRWLLGGAAAIAGVGAIGLFTFDRVEDGRRAEALVAEADRLFRSGLPADRSRGEQLITRALSLDPNSASAHGRLAYEMADAVVNEGGRNVAAAMRSAQRAIRAALAKDPQEPYALLAQLILEKSHFDWSGLENGLRALYSSAPANASVLNQLTALLQAAGRTLESWRFNEREFSLDRLSPGPQYRRALKLWILGRGEDAYQAIERLIYLWPSHPWVWNARLLILAFSGRAEAALAMIDDPRQRLPNVSPQRLAQWRPTLAALTSPGPAKLASAVEANIAAARQSPGQAAYAAMALAGLGEIDAAYRITDGFLLARGPLIIERPSDGRNRLSDAPSWRRTQWLFTPPMTDFRRDARFVRLCDGIGLTAYWRERNIQPEYLPARV
jgi:DNA-binding winged helix-turn-helix (wHTH) protein